MSEKKLTIFVMKPPSLPPPNTLLIPAKASLITFPISANQAPSLENDSLKNLITLLLPKNSPSLTKIPVKAFHPSLILSTRVVQPLPSLENKLSRGLNTFLKISMYCLARPITEPASNAAPAKIISNKPPFFKSLRRPASSSNDLSSVDLIDSSLLLSLSASLLASALPSMPERLDVDAAALTDMITGIFNICDVRSAMLLEILERIKLLAIISSPLSILSFRS